MKHRKGHGKKYDIYMDILRVFKRNPNKLYQPREIRRALPLHNDSAIYHTLTILNCEGKLNKDIISGRKYYWMTRK